MKDTLNEQLSALVDDELDTGEAALLLRQMGNIASGKSELTEAINHYEHALTLFQQLEDLTWIGGTCQNLGNLLAFGVGDFPKALSVMELGLSCFRKMQDPGGIAWMLLGMLGVSIYQGHLM